MKVKLGMTVRTQSTVGKKFPLNPKFPERICWGCDRYCPTGDMACGNGSGRTQHPSEVLGEDWYLVGDWGMEESEGKPAAEDIGP